MLRRTTLAIAFCAIALILPLAVSAAETTAADAYVQTMSELGEATPAPDAGADVAVGNGTAFACPGGVVPPHLDPAFCPLGPREFRFAGASNLADGGAHGVFHGETLDRFTGETRTTIRGPIFCVTVTANKAVIGVIAEQVTSLSPGQGIAEGTAFYVPMLDNGNDPAVPDLYGPYYLPGTPPTDVAGQCTLDFAPLMTVTDGHVIVRDGQVAGSS